MGLGHQDIEQGDHDFLHYWPQQDGRLRTTRSYVKLNHQIDPNSAYTLQWYANAADTQWPSICQTDTLENQLEGQFEFIPAKDHHMSVGANFRHTDIDQTVRTSDDVMLSGTPNQEQRVGLFCIDRWSQSQYLDVEGQGYAEWYSESGTDWAGRLSALYSPDEEKRHVFRVSGAKSYRTPLIGLRHLSVSHLGGAIRVLEGGDLDNEHIWSLEAGYHHHFSQLATLNVNAYWQHYRDLVGYVKRANGFQPQNLGHAKADGVEIEMALQPKAAKLSFWYAYNWFETTSEPQDQSSEQEVRAFRPARHKAGATLRFFLPYQFVANINGKYCSKTIPQGPLGRAIPEHFRFDLTLSKQLAISDLTGELMLGVMDIFNETELMVGDHGTYVTRHPTPGRTYFLRAAVQF